MFYRKTGGLRLTEETIHERLREVLEGFEGYLRSHLRGYDGLPDGVKIALLDMVYNLGPGRLFQEYPKLLAAVESRNWAAAAAASLRKGPSAARNAWTREQFLSAAKQIALQAEAALERNSPGWFPVLLASGAALILVLAASRRTGAGDGPRLLRAGLS